MEFDWKHLVATVAPAIASTFGGPLAGLGVGAVVKALGLSEDSNDASISAALAGATPDQMLALKKADQDFKVQMTSLGIDLEKVNAADRQSARGMQISLRSWMPGVLAILITAGFFGVLGWMFKFGLSKDTAGSEALLLMLGALSASWGAVVNFFFGSSSGSASKDEVIGKMAK